MYNSKDLYFYYDLTLKDNGDNQINQALIDHQTFYDNEERRPAI